MALAMLYLWCSSLLVCKKIALYFFVVSSIGKQHCYEAWWPKTARPACPGTATTHIRTCAGTSVTRKSRKPSWRCYTIAIRQKTNHEELSLAFLSISKINIILTKVCIIEQMKERWYKHLLFKKIKHFKTIYNNIYLQCLFASIYMST